MTTQITHKQAEGFSEALADIICWMDGFKAAGGVYYPDSIGVLRTLNLKMKEIWEQENTTPTP